MRKRIGKWFAIAAIPYTVGTFFVIDHTAFFINIAIGAMLGVGYVVGRGIVRDYRQWRAALDEGLAVAVTRDPDLIVEMYASYFDKSIAYIFAYDDEATFFAALEREYVA